MREQALEKKLIGEIQHRGGLAIKWVAPGTSGVPDRILLLPGGHIYFVELKTKTGRLSKRQKYIHEQFKHLGIEVITIYGLEGVKKLLERIDANGV